MHWQITDDGSRTLWNEQLDETYHSGCGAVLESLVVYLHNSAILARMSKSEPTAVLEYGLGTGTAFLLTAAVAELHRAALRYRALELSVLPAAVFADLRFDDCKLDRLDDASAARFGEVLHAAQRLIPKLAQWRSSLPEEVVEGTYRATITEHVELEVVVGDACNYRAGNGDSFDAVYFDPFSPATNPLLWTREVYEVAMNSLRPGGALVSYCVKSAVRHDLEALGFAVHKLSGPVGGKREVLMAVKPLDV